MRRFILLIMAVLCLASVLSIAPVTSQAASVAKPPRPGSSGWVKLNKHLLAAGDQSMLAQIKAGKGTRRIDGSWFSGFGDFMVTGNNAKQVWTTFYVPKVNCSQSTYGSSGEDILYLWAGLGAGVLEQDGVEVVCVQGNNTPQYSSWSYFCCTGSLDYSPIVPSPGDEFSAVVCAPNVCNGSTGYYFGLQDVTTNTSYSREAFCPSGLTCDDSAAIGTMEVGNSGAASLGTIWDLAKYSWLGTNGEIGSTINSDNGQGTFTPKSGAWTNFQWQMYDSHDVFMNTTGNLTNGGNGFTWTYDGCC